MNLREEPEDIPLERVQLYLPETWAALKPSERETLIRILRSYSAEVQYQHGVPVVAADVIADKLEERGSRD